MAKQQKKRRRTETQHYVPQLYLRGFTNASGCMFCYDKQADRSHLTTTKAAAQEPYFYELPPALKVPLNTAECFGTPRPRPPGSANALRSGWARRTLRALDAPPHPVSRQTYFAVKREDSRSEAVTRVARAFAA
jgi:hypothetical protein